MKEKLLLAAAALLGFATACNNEEDQPKVVSMYGVPYNNYKIKGKVTDKAGRPIKGIEVRSNAYLPTPEATTAADGTYDLSGKGVGNTARVTFTDTDGPANGGDFAAKTVDIEFTEAERTAKGDGDWDQGHSPNRASTSPSRRRSSPCSRPARLPGRKNAPANAQTSLALRPAFTIFTEHRMRLGNAQTSLALRSTFTIFAGWIHSITTSNS